MGQEWGVSAEQKVLLYVGRIAAEKNIPLAIQAYQRAQLQHPDIKLVMVGDGPMREDLHKEYPDIVFAGVQTGDTLARYFASADVFVFPSLTETFGLVTLEAMASGLPVVAFDMAAAHKYVSPGLEGVLATVDDELSFIQSLDALLAMDVTVLGSQARRKAETLSWDAVGTLLMTLLEDELQRHKQASSSSLRTLV